MMGCTSCPSCGSILTIDAQPSYSGTGTDDSETVCLYSCGYCHWSSRECDIAVPLTAADDMELAIYRLRSLLTERIASRSVETDFFVDASVKGWGKRITVEDRRKRNEERPGGGVTTRQTDRLGGGGITELVAGLEGGGWGIDRMEEDVRRRKDGMKEDLVTGVIPLGDKSGTWNKLTVLDAVPPAATKEEEKGKKEHAHIITSTQTTGQNTISSSSTVSSLLPVPLPLRARYVRRCCAELAKGRPGILVKPKVNPLEGDSSLRFGHGQWWKKESSAIHIVPKVQIHKYGGKDGHHALLLQIKNPTLGMVRLRLHNAYFPCNSTSISFPKRYEEFAMNSTTIQTTCARVISPPHMNTTTTATDDASIMEAVMLESVEDAFLELGKGHGRDPPAVQKWNATSVLDGYLNRQQQSLEGGDGEGREGVVVSDTLSPSCDRFGLIAQAKDVAWIQCIVTEEEGIEHLAAGSKCGSDNGGEGGGGDDGDSGGVNETLPEEDSFVSTPLVMDIEIGNGSWETSWIQAIKKNKGSGDRSKKNEEEEKDADGGGDQDAGLVDYASFTILPVWKV